MNELQRQMYLSALGVDSYMPRLHLSFAPEPQLCELPEHIFENVEPAVTVAPSLAPKKADAVVEISPVNNLIDNFIETKKSKPTPISAADILAQLDTKPITLDAFTLSIWRPLQGVMVIDSRNAKLALPTELFLTNILRAMFSGQALAMQEEVLRWPMIENSFAKRTEEDARAELQTWLAVQHEIRPLHCLWLMGENATRYFLPKGSQTSDKLFQTVHLGDTNLNALILPSLNDLLQKPALKQQLFFALRRYLQPHESI